SRFDQLIIMLALLWGCNRTHNLNFETAPLGTERVRQAPAVAVDPAPAFPEPRTSAPSDEGLVVLEAPAGEQADQALIKRFFEAVIARDAARLETFFENGAKTKTSAQASGTDAVDFWKSRLSRLDYSQLSGQNV